MPDFHHGVRVIEALDGVRPITTVATAIIAVVVTAPDAQTALAASVNIGDAALNTGITLSAKNTGLGSNDIAIKLVNPGANDAVLAVDVSSKLITVSLATDLNGNITSTAGDVIAAINAEPLASALVTASDTDSSDGTGVMRIVRRTSLVGGEDEPFPLNQPVLIAGSRSKAAKLDTTGNGLGTGPAVMDAIFDQGGAMVIVVRVQEGVDAAATTANVIGTVRGDGRHTGIQALRTAKAKLGMTPRIIAAPGLDVQAVTTELVSLANSVRGFVYATADGAYTAEAAVDYRNNFGSKRLMIIWSDFERYDIAEKATVTAWATARAVGLRAKLDNEIGWHKTLSNMEVQGVTGIDKDISWSLQDPNTTAGYLNRNEVTTLIREGGFRFWGNRTCSEDPLFAFESATRTGDVLADTIAEAHMWAIDKPMSKTLIQEILEGVNAKFRELKAQGYIVDATAWIDAEKNTNESLARGELWVDYDYSPVPPLESLNFISHITTSYLSQLVAA